MNSHLSVRGRGLRPAVLAAFLITAAPAVAATAPSGGGPPVTMVGAGDTKAVSYGEHVRFAGAVPTRQEGGTVRLEYAPLGGGWRQLAQATTAGDGGYRFSVRARRSGSYRAVGTAGASAARRLTVRARVQAGGTHHVLGNRAVRVRGRVKPGVGGRSVYLQRSHHRRWKTVDRTRTREGGRFRASFRPGAPGSYRLRVRFRGDGTNAAAERRLRRTYVYRSGQASYYGPGLYGGHLACGGTLTPGKLGVANKSLPCGTRVTFRHRGRSVTVPVVDRGPYAGGREWDLTAATKRRLGFGTTGIVWSTR